MPRVWDVAHAIPEALEELVKQAAPLEKRSPRRRGGAGDGGPSRQGTAVGYERERASSTNRLTVPDQ